MRHRRTVIAAAAALTLFTMAARHPTADLRIITHEAGDPAPRRVQAAVDLGLMGVSVLYTWTKRLH